MLTENKLESIPTQKELEKEIAQSTLDDVNFMEALDNNDNN